MARPRRSGQGQSRRQDTVAEEKTDSGAEKGAGENGNAANDMKELSAEPKTDAPAHANEVSNDMGEISSNAGGSEAGIGSKDNPINIELKYKDEWTSAQRAEADAKLQMLSEVKTVKTSVNRSGTLASARYKSAYGNTSVPEGYDVDHTINLQLGGEDDTLNMNPLDSSVNRSLGAQIKNAIKDYPDGTEFGTFTIH